MFEKQYTEAYFISFLTISSANDMQYVGQKDFHHRAYSESSIPMHTKHTMRLILWIWFLGLSSQLDVSLEGLGSETMLSQTVVKYHSETNNREEIKFKKNLVAHMQSWVFEWYRVSGKFDSKQNFRREFELPEANVVLHVSI